MLCETRNFEEAKFSLQASSRTAVLMGSYHGMTTQET
jgi:hypothetical protein